MIQQFVTEVKDSARATARAAAMSAIGSIFALIGLGFLTAALWLLLASQEGVLFAATVIGALYVGLGFICLAIAAKTRSGHTPHGTATSERTRGSDASHEATPPLMQMAEGFAIGMQAGRSARTPNA